MNKITMAQDWKDKVVFYNGQIVPKGAATVKILLEEGIKHVAILDVNEEVGKSLQDELNEKYGFNRVKFIKCDVFDEDQLLNSFKAVLEEQGYIDVVVNYAFLMNDSKETYKKMINLNFTSLVTSTLKSMEFMSKENGGRGGTVINFTSILTLFQSELLPIYSATKSAISMFSNCIGRQEYYLRTGVRVITVAPGAYDSAILHPDNLKSFDKHVEASFAEAFSKFPLQRVESAAQGMVDVFKLAETGSTWIVINDRPAKDITATIKEVYELMSSHLFE